LIEIKIRRLRLGILFAEYGRQCHAYLHHVDATESPDNAKQDHFISERHYGDFHRTFRVPDGVDTDKIEATFKNSVLSVTLPKTAEARRKQKKVEIKSA
jgi:HSP20 family protein